MLKYVNIDELGRVGIASMGNGSKTYLSQRKSYSMINQTKM